MTQPGSPAADEVRTPPLAQDLDAVHVRYTWKFGEGGKGMGPPGLGAGAETPATGALSLEEEMVALRAQVQRFTTALEDIVTLALSSADYKERAIMMHRRAVAALSGLRVSSNGVARK